MSGNSLNSKRHKLNSKHLVSFIAINQTSSIVPVTYLILLDSFKKATFFGIRKKNHEIKKLCTCFFVHEVFFIKQNFVKKTQMKFSKIYISNHNTRKICHAKSRKKQRSMIHDELIFYSHSLYLAYALICCDPNS